MTSIVPMYRFVEVQLTDVSLWAKTLYEDKQNRELGLAVTGRPGNILKLFLNVVREGGIVMGVF